MLSEHDSIYMYDREAYRQGLYKSVGPGYICTHVQIPNYFSSCEQGYIISCPSENEQFSWLKYK